MTFEDREPLTLESAPYIRVSYVYALPRGAFDVLNTKVLSMFLLLMLLLKVDTHP